MSNPLRLLLVEDSEADAELLAQQLRRAGFTLAFERVETAHALAAALARAPWDLIISDNSMPGFSGTEALSLLRSRGLDIPFIFVSGTMEEDLAARALDAGAGDALEKGNLQRLIPVIRRELREFGERKKPRCASRKPHIARSSSKRRWASTGRRPRDGSFPPTPRSPECSATTHQQNCSRWTWRATCTRIPTSVAA